MEYLTPARFRSMGFGNDLTDVTDVQLRSFISRATAKVNSYCAVPQIPAGHDFRGGAIVGEQHDWPLPDLTIIATPGARRVYPYHEPINTITQFVVKFTNTYQITVDPSNLYVDRSEGWAEVVSIAAVVSGVYPVGINFGLYTPVAVVDYTYGWTYNSVGETLDETDGQTFRAMNQFWLAQPVVYIDGAVQGSGYSYDLKEGTVTFTGELAATAHVTADYTYSLPTPIAEATGTIVSEDLAEAALIAKGMGGIGALRVAEVELTRYRPPRMSGQEALVSTHVAALLDPYKTITARL